MGTHMLIKDLTLELTTKLVQTLTSTLSTTLTQALTRNPKDDYYGEYCQKHGIYCSLAYKAMQQEYDNNYYANYYGQYYSNYYTYYYGTVLADRFSQDAINRGIHAPERPKQHKEGGDRVDG